jgi:hypothetical protein
MKINDWQKYEKEVEKLKPSEQSKEELSGSSFPTVEINNLILSETKCNFGRIKTLCYEIIPGFIDFFLFNIFESVAQSSGQNYFN